MSDELRGVVVCHAKLAGALVEAAEQISGVRGALVPVSNADCDRGALEQRVAQAVDGTPTVVFVDMSSGSCLFAVLNRLRESTDVKVVTGVNLAMLVDFLFHRSLARGGRGSRRCRRGQGDRNPLMPIALCRVDDRLVHGQVVIGWGRPLAIELIVLVDDTVTASPWEQDLYRMAVSPEIEVHVRRRRGRLASAARVAELAPVAC